MSQSVNPSNQELLFKTWEQIKQFMLVVRREAEKLGMSRAEADEFAVSWGDKIFNQPLNVEKIMQVDWPKELHRMKLMRTISETQELLENNGLSEGDARKQATIYANELNSIDAMDQNRVKQIQLNLNNLVNEYRIRLGHSVMKEPIPFPKLYSVKEWYEYVADQALRGDWFPFARYVAQKNGVHLQPAQVKSFSLNPEQFDQILKGNRVEKKILSISELKILAVIFASSMTLQAPARA